MILIIGSEEEAHCAYIYNKLILKNKRVCYFDSRKYPGNIMISWCPTGDVSEGSIVVNNEKILLKDIEGIYWRWFYGVPFETIEDGANTAFLSNMVYRERESLLTSLFSSLKTRWVNSYNAVQLHKKKAFQTNIMNINGIRVPDTLITNDSQSVVEFFEKNNGQIIYKPVLGGAFTSKLSREDLSPDRLATLKTSPVQFQEYIEGIDIRVYAFEENVYAAEIEAQTLDFRADDKAVLNKVILPEHIINDCRKILKLLDLKYSGIDIRLTPQGEYVFIEANPAPMFIHFENTTKYPITEEILRLLGAV